MDITEAQTIESPVSDEEPIKILTPKERRYLNHAAYRARNREKLKEYKRNYDKRIREENQKYHEVMRMLQIQKT
jgi:hypothetical protein